MCRKHWVDKLYHSLFTSLFYFSDKLAGECFGQKLSRPRRFALGGAAVLFHSIYGTTAQTIILKTSYLQLFSLMHVSCVDGAVTGGVHAVESISQSSFEL